jgi:hypothetical protein
MQSTDYVKESLNDHPQGKDFLSKIMSEIAKQGSSVVHHAQGHHAMIPSTTTSMTTTLWMIRKVWNHYRIGTVDEVQHYIKSKLASSSSYSSLPVTDLTSDDTTDTTTATNTTDINAPEKADALVTNESKQVMSLATFQILLNDMTDYCMQDLREGGKRYVKVLQYVEAYYRTPNKKQYLTFSEYTHIIEDIITIVRQPPIR